MMRFIKKDGIALAYEDLNPGASPILFIHGWSCDHRIFASQANYFRRSHHVVSVDLRGHGQSDAPVTDYTMAAYAEDIAFLCAEINLVDPIVVGHSMGGNVAMELAARYPEIPDSIILIDSFIFPPDGFVEALQSFEEVLREPDYVPPCQEAMSSVCLPTDDKLRRTEFIASLPKAPQHVLLSSLANHLTKYDPTSAAAGCRVPVAYIGAAVLMADLVRLRSLIPQLITAQTLGAGHFSPLFVPDQINAMLSTFMRVYSPVSREY
jgi:pimeloyl-ACP methyl ester carboxylesterase